MAGLINSELPNGGLINSELPNGGLINSELPNGGLINSELPNGGLIHSELPNGGLTKGGLTHSELSNGGLANSGLTNSGLTNSAFLAAVCSILLTNTMAEQNVPTQLPTRIDEQIIPRSQWLIIEKSNLLFNAQKIQKNPIFQISVDILSNTNFFRAFTTLANVPAIYLQQFWNTMKYDEKTGVYRC
ncbi:hypothetical protein Tco_0037474, partial [Tanacetum coccineum]